MNNIIYENTLVDSKKKNKSTLRTFDKYTVTSTEIEKRLNLTRSNMQMGQLPVDRHVSTIPIN